MLQSYRTCKKHMAKNPYQTEHPNCDDAYESHKTDLCLIMIDTSLRNFPRRSQSDFNPMRSNRSRLMTVFISSFESKNSTAGGPPGVLSIFEGVVSLVSQDTRASVK